MSYVIDIKGFFCVSLFEVFVFLRDIIGLVWFIEAIKLNQHIKLFVRSNEAWMLSSSSIQI